MRQQEKAAAVREWRTLCVQRALSSPRNNKLFEELLSSPNPLLRTFSIAFEAVLPHLSFRTFSCLSRSCKELRFCTGSIRWLHYCLEHLPPCNAVHTRRMFLLPGKSQLQLHNAKRARYMQHSAFKNALVQHGSLPKLRVAFMRRYKLRAAREEREQKYEARLRGLREALIADGISASIMWTTNAGLHFRFQSQWFPDSLFPTLLRQTVYKLQKHWYLTRHTDFIMRLSEHLELYGEYDNAYNNVSQFYTFPVQWPWHNNVSTGNNNATANHNTL